MKIEREINGEMMEIEITAEELSKAYYEQEHLFDIKECRNYVENETDYNNSLLLFYLDEEGYESFLSAMAYSERRRIDKVGLSNLDMSALMEEVFWQTFESINKLEMPDKAISVQHMFDFGYTWGGMLPISSKEIAMNLSDKMNVFELHHDGSGSLCVTKNDFDGFNLYGVHKTDWEKYLQEKKNSKSKTYSPDISTIIRGGERFCCMFLDRLRSDCNYFLSYGNANEKDLWAGDVNSHMDLMEDIYTAVFADNEIPLWLTMKEIREYRVKMLEALKNKDSQPIN